MKTENDVLKTLCFIREMTRPVCYFHEFSSNHASETQGIQSAICDIEKHSNPNGLLDILRTRNRVPKTLCFIREMR